MNFEKLISNTFEFKKAEMKQSESLNVSYCIDDNFSMPCGISLLSLLENNTDLNINVYLFVLSLSEVNKSKFVDIISRYNNANLYIYYVNDNFNINDHNQKNFPLSASLRIIAPEILKDKCDYLLYIDADTLVVGSIKGILQYKNEKIISAVLDFGVFKVLIRTKSESGLYFNSGILFFNNNKWHQENITQLLIKLLLNNDYLYPDQDALNHLLSNDCNYLPLTFNFHHKIKNNYKTNDLKIVHYTGHDKPWYSLFLTPEYSYYLKKSPWSNEKLKLAHNYSRIRVYSKNIKKQSILKSLKYYFIYLFTKFKEKRNKAH